MAAIPGSRDVSTAGDDAERQSVARQYVEAMAAMHRLPLEPFVARGLTLPEGADEIALAGLHAYYPMYARRKTGPQPLVEFAIGWLKRSEEHTSELQSLMRISYAVFCLKQKTNKIIDNST